MSNPYSHIKEILNHHKTILDIGAGPLMDTLVSFLKENREIEKLFAIDKEERNSSFFQNLKTQLSLTNDEAFKLYLSKCQYIKCDITINEIPLKDNYDIIIMSNILHFLNKEKRSEVFNWCAEHLNKNGILFIRANHTANKTIPNQASKKELLGNEIRYSNEKGISYYLFDHKDLLLDLKQLKEQTSFYERTDEYFTAVFIKSND